MIEAFEEKIKKKKEEQEKRKTAGKKAKESRPARKDKMVVKMGLFKVMSILQYFVILNCTKSVSGKGLHFLA